MNSIHWLEWPAEKHIKACFTTRKGGFSQQPFNGFNLGDHVGDDTEAVRQNRQHLSTLISQNHMGWLKQVHGVDVSVWNERPLIEADASVTDKKNQVCVIMTADCLPVFFTDQLGSKVAIAHAGWRGLAAGILQKTLTHFTHPNQVMVYFGPAISVKAFEVGEEVRETFLSRASSLERYFLTKDPASNKWMCDLYGLARAILTEAGVTRFYGGDRCTYTEEAHFFSYRRDGQTGRMANLIWIDS